MVDIEDQVRNGIQFDTPYRLEREKGVGAWPRSEFLLRAGYKVRILTTADEARAIVPQWRRLLTESGTKSLFQSADWCMAILDAIAYLDRRDVEVYLVTVQSGERLVCLLPMMVETRFGLRQARILGEPISQYSEILVAPGFPGVVDRAIAGFIEQVHVDVIRLRRVRDGGPLDAAMRQWCALVNEVESAPYIGVAATPVNRKIRDMQRRCRRKAEQKLFHSEVLTGTECAVHSQQAIQMKTRWLADHRLVSRAFADPLWRDALGRTMSGHSPQITPVITGVSNGDTMIAYNVAYLVDDVLYGFLSAHDRAHKALAPGYAAIVAEFEWAQESGVSCLDMLAPKMPYKDSLSAGEVTVRDYAMPLTRKGAFYSRFVDGSLRHFMKKHLERMPSFMRRLAIRFS